MDCSLPGSSVHEILQARILEVDCHALIRWVPDPGIQPASLASPALAGEFFTTSTTWEAHLGRHLWGALFWFISALMRPCVGHLTRLRTRVSSSKSQSLSEPIRKDPTLSILRYATANTFPTLVFWVFCGWVLLVRSTSEILNIRNKGARKQTDSLCEYPSCFLPAGSEAPRHWETEPWEPSAVPLITQGELDTGWGALRKEEGKWRCRVMLLTPTRPCGLQTTSF